MGLVGGGGCAGQPPRPPRFPGGAPRPGVDEMGACGGAPSIAHPPCRGQTAPAPWGQPHNSHPFLVGRPGKGAARSGFFVGRLGAQASPRPPGFWRGPGAGVDQGAVGWHRAPFPYKAGATPAPPGVPPFPARGFGRSPAGDVGPNRVLVGCPGGPPPLAPGLVVPAAGVDESVLVGPGWPQNPSHLAGSVGFPRGGPEPIGYKGGVAPPHPWRHPFPPGRCLWGGVPEPVGGAPRVASGPLAGCVPPPPLGGLVGMAPSPPASWRARRPSESAGGLGRRLPPSPGFGARGVSPVPPKTRTDWDSGVGGAPRGRKTSGGGKCGEGIRRPGLDSWSWQRPLCPHNPPHLKSSEKVSRPPPLGGGGARGRRRAGQGRPPGLAPRGSGGRRAGPLVRQAFGPNPAPG